MGIGHSQFDRPFLIRNAAGECFYESAAFVHGIHEVANKDSATIGRGEAVRLDAASSVYPRWDYATSGADVNFATKVYMGVKRISAATNKNLLGVALEDIPANVDGRVCLAGSVTAVKCINPPASVVEGAPVIGSSTAGSVDTLAPKAAGAAEIAAGDGTVLGNMVMRPGTAAAQSGSNTQLICLISPH